MQMKLDNPKIYISEQFNYLYGYYAYILHKIYDYCWPIQEASASGSMNIVQMTRLDVKLLVNSTSTLEVCIIPFLEWL